MTDQRAIETAIEEFIKAYNAGDIHGVLSYYAPDLIKVRNGAPPESKAEIEQRLVALFSKFLSRVEVTNDEIVVSGDFAFTRGSFRVSVTPRAGGETQEIDRRYLEVWRRESGRWLVARTMDNVP